MFLDPTIKIDVESIELSLDNTSHLVRDHIIASGTWQYFVTRVHVRCLLSKWYTIIRWSEPNHGTNRINLIFRKSCVYHTCAKKTSFGTLFMKFIYIISFRVCHLKWNPIIDTNPTAHSQLNVRNCPVMPWYISVIIWSQFENMYGQNISLPVSVHQLINARATATTNYKILNWLKYMCKGRLQNVVPFFKAAMYMR